MKPSSYEKWKSQACLLASAHLENGTPAQAEAVLRKVLAVRPEEAECRVQLARALHEMHDASRFRAEASFLSLMGRSVSPQERLQLLRSLTEQFPEDLNFKSKAAELALALKQIELADALHQRLAEIYLDKGLPMTAVRMYEKILETGKNQMDVLRKIADIYAGEGVYDQAIRRYFELADRLSADQMLEEAAAIYEQILSIDPTNPEACVPLSKIYLLCDRAADASKIMHRQIDSAFNKGRLDEALLLSRNFVDVLLDRNRQTEAIVELEQMAQALLPRGRKNDAAALLGRAAELALALPNLDQFIRLSKLSLSVYREQNERKRHVVAAQNMILAILTLDPARADLLLEETLDELLKENQVPEADELLHHLSKTLELEKRLPLAEALLIRLADLYAGLYRPAEAIKTLESIAHGGSENPSVFERLAKLYAEEKNIPRSTDFSLSAMDLYIRRGEREEAQKIFESAARKDSKNPALLSKRGDVSYSAGEWDQALHYYQKALALDASLRPAVIGTAMTFAKKGMLDEMVSLAKRSVAKGLIAEIVEEYRKALAVTHSPSECSIALGTLYKDLGFMDEAVLEFQNALKDPAAFLTAHNLLGLCYAASGFNDLAIRQFRRALTSPDHAEEETLPLRYNLALLYEAAGMKAEAHDLYNDILVLDIGYKDVKARLRNLGHVKGSGKVLPFGSGGEGK